MKVILFPMSGKEESERTATLCCDGAGVAI